MTGEEWNKLTQFEQSMQYFKPPADVVAFGPAFGNLLGSPIGIQEFSQQVAKRREEARKAELREAWVSILKTLCLVGCGIVIGLMI